MSAAESAPEPAVAPLAASQSMRNVMEAEAVDEILGALSEEVYSRFSQLRKAFQHFDRSGARITSQSPRSRAAPPRWCYHVFPHRLMHGIRVVLHRS